jgi:carboxypeptidase C (cathepsin A)
MKLLCLPFLILCCHYFFRGADAFEKSDFLVTGLGEIEPAYDAFAGDMYAGRLPIDIAPIAEGEKRGELMFWFFQPNHLNHDSITIWLNGGPGCTSFSAGVLLEISPVTSPHFPAGHPKTTKTQPLSPNEWAWTKATNMLFVEQPAGTGFSKGPMPQSEADLSIDFYNFLVNFYETFPDMKPKKLFLVGESYAGMYVPSIAHQINLENKKGERSIPLTGIGLGNGWMDASVQGETVIDYAYWHGMIDSTARLALHEIWKDCVAGARMDPPFHDFTTPDDCNMAGATLAAAGAGIFPDMSPNAYDVTTWDKVSIFLVETIVLECIR